jgi:hypothetical protein
MIDEGKLTGIRDERGRRLVRRRDVLALLRRREVEARRKAEFAAVGAVGAGVVR